MTILSICVALWSLFASPSVVLQQDTLGHLQFLNAEIINQALSVTIRAPEEDLARITASHIRAVADLSEVSESNAAGFISPAVRIFIDGFPTAGVVGRYSIIVTLTPWE